MQRQILVLINVLSVYWYQMVVFKTKLECADISFINENIKNVIKKFLKDKNIDLIKKLNSLITSLNSYKKQKKTSLEYIEPVFREILKTITGEL